MPRMMSPTSMTSRPLLLGRLAPPTTTATDQWSHLPGWSAAPHSPQARGLNPDLRGVEIELWLIQRKQRQQGDGEAVLQFFRSWLAEHGGQVRASVRTSGIND